MRERYLYQVGAIAITVWAVMFTEEGRWLQGNFWSLQPTLQIFVVAMLAMVVYFSPYVAVALYLPMNLMSGWASDFVHYRTGYRSKVRVDAETGLITGAEEDKPHEYTEMSQGMRNSIDWDE